MLPPYIGLGERVRLFVAYVSLSNLPGFCDLLPLVTHSNLHSGWAITMQHTDHDGYRKYTWCDDCMPGRESHHFYSPAAPTASHAS